MARDLDETVSVAIGLRADGRHTQLNPDNDTTGMGELGPAPTVPGNGGASAGGQMSRNMEGTVAGPETPYKRCDSGAEDDCDAATDSDLS